MLNELDFEGNEQTSNNMLPCLLCINYEMHNSSVCFAHIALPVYTIRFYLKAGN